jgi:hypothetical protein
MQHKAAIQGGRLVTTDGMITIEHYTGGVKMGRARNIQKCYRLTSSYSPNIFMFAPKCFKLYPPQKIMHIHAGGHMAMGWGTIWNREGGDISVFPS